jgi:hypothetical protein
MKSQSVLLAVTLGLFTASLTFAGEAPLTDAKSEKAEASPKKPEAAKPARKAMPEAKPEAKPDGMPKAKSRVDPCRVDPDMPGCARATDKNQ